jgi:hypothetical protein
MPPVNAGLEAVEEESVDWKRGFWDWRLTMRSALVVRNALLEASIVIV